jgi:hypothetical protein
MGKGAIYTKNAISDYQSVTILKFILDPNHVICDVKDNDKVPNYDGYLDLINPNGEPLGKLEVQVKTLKKGSIKATYSIKRKLIEYVAKSAQLPVLLIAVDQEHNKAFWEHLSIQRTKDLLIELDQSKKQSATIHFPDVNEVTLNAPYKAWVELANDYKRRIDENENLESSIYELKIDKNTHLLIQLEQLNNLLYQELEFIPIHILIQLYPFRDKHNSRYNNFVLTTYNDKFRALFESIDITGQNKINIIDSDFFKEIEKPQSVIPTVLKKLTSNLIYYIDTPYHQEYIDVRCFDNVSCTCARCQIEIFSFETIDFSIEVKDSKIDELLNKAYGHYKMGRFLNVYRIYKEALKLARNEKKLFSAYLIEYNLTHLASLIEQNYYDDDEAKVIAKELREINISNSYFPTKNTIHREIQEWMLNDYYMKHFHSNISEIKQQLIDHYQNSINNGSGTNSYVNELINQYVQLNQFLQQNTIINDCYKTYHDIVEMVIEGLFASYSVEGERSSKLDSFNDWLLSQIIKYGRTRSIRKLANRYKIKELHYETLNIDHESIKEQILRLFDQFETATKKLDSIDEPNYNYFSIEYKKWLNNALYIVGLVDFDKDYIIRFTDSFLSYYKRNTYRLDTMEIESFLIRKFHYLTYKQQKEMFLMGIREDQLLRSYFLQNFARLCEVEQVAFKLTTKDLNLIVKRPFSQLSNIVSLVHVYRCLSNIGQKNVVQHRILKVLNDSFRLDIWNSAILHDVIPLKDEDLAKAIQILTPNKNIAGQPGNPFGGSRYNGGLDQFINICFDKDIDLTDSKFDGLQDNSSYYKWLLDIDGFDYKDFDPNWLMEYGTEPYLKRFSESSLLKNHIQSLLIDPTVKNKEGLKEVFMDIYVLKSLEK